MRSVVTRSGEVLQEPRFVRWLFNDVRAGLIWLPLRLWLAYQWIEAALHKLSNPAWVGTGEALRGFWMNAVTIPESGRPAIAYDWYRAFIQMLLDAQAYTWFAKLVSYGELLVGIALVLGAFTGVAAFFSAVMNWNYMMAGTASANPMLLLVGIVLLVAWKVAGRIGADYFLLQRITMPWQRRGPIKDAPFQAERQPGEAAGR
jgi:thiosulfate dehydrogenase [quinone] large subunit